MQEFDLPSFKGRFLEETAKAAAAKCTSKKFYDIACVVMEVGFVNS